MQTDVKIPEYIFEAATQLAAKLDMSLSEFYTAALTAYLTANQLDDHITNKLNEIYDHEQSSIDPVLVKIQVASMEKDSW